MKCVQMEAKASSQKWKTWYSDGILVKFTDVQEGYPYEMIFDEYIQITMYNADKFIDCALQQKYITLNDLEECRLIQKRYPTLSTDQILRTHGFIDNAKCSIIEALLKYKDEDGQPRLLTSVKRKKRPHPCRNDVGLSNF